MFGPQLIISENRTVTINNSDINAAGNNIAERMIQIIEDFLGQLHTYNLF